jgi:phage tail-like protein
MIIEPLRNDLLERFLERPEYWRDEIKAKIAEVVEYPDPRTCPDDRLIYLKDLVGWTDDLGITDGLSAADLRKLVRLAIPIWKQKGTELGLVNLARLLTGKNVIYGNWFYFRWILGETGLWEEQAGSDPWILGGEISDYGEYWSNLRVMDSPDLDHGLLESAIAIERPVNERIELVYLDMLDWFNEDLRYWSHEVVGKEGYIDTTNHRFVIPAGGRERIVVPWISAWQYMVSIVSARRPTAPSTADTFRLRFHVQDVDNCYIAQIKPGGIELIRRLASVESTLASIAGSFHAVQYKLRVETFDTGGGTIKIRIYIDANLEIEHTLAAPSFTSGHIEIENPNGANDIEADNVEVFEKDLEYVVIGP